MLNLVVAATPDAMQGAVAAEVTRRLERPHRLVIGRSGRLNRVLMRRAGGALNVHFLTIEQLVDALLEDAELGGRRPIRDEGLLVEILRQKNMPIFGQALYQVIRDLKDAALLPEPLLEAANLQPDLWEPQKLRDLACLYAAYEESLRRLGFWDPSDLFRLAAAAAPTAPLVRDAERILVVGYYDMTQVQFDLLEALARVGPPVDLYFPARLLGPARRFYESFALSLVDRTGGTVSRVGPAAPPPLTRDLFSDSFEAAVEPGPIEIASVSGRHDELWLCAKRILALLDTGSVRPHEIGVVARTLEPYADLIEPVFRDHAIPFTTSARRPFRATPLAKTLERILELPDLDYDRAAVLEVLASGLVRLPPGSDPSLWDLEASQRAIGRGAAAWRERAQGLLREAFDMVYAAVAPLLERGSWRAHAAAALRAWEALLVMPVDPSARAALRSLEELDQVRGEGGEPVERERFLEALRERFEAAGEPIGGDRDLDAVQILDVMAARGLCFRHLFLIGLNEKSFPRFIHEEPFLRDHNRRVLSDTLGVKLDPKLDGMGEERLLFATALDSATETRTLVFQRADDEGRPLAPSPFLREVAYRLPAAKGRRFDDVVGTVLSRLPQERLRAVDDARCLTPAELLMVRPDLHALRAEMAADGERLARSIAFVRELEDAERLGRLDGTIGADAIEPFWRDYRARVSPTMIETYAACPARALFGRVLKLERFERPEDLDEVAPTEIGRLVHSILEGFYRRYRPGAEVEPLLQRVWKTECAKTRNSIFVRHEIEWEIETEHIFRALRRFLIEEDLPELHNLNFEVLLERKGEVSVGEVRFEGFIDRIVVAGVQARVDDYKWKAKSDPSERAALRGLSVQLPLYARMAAELLKDRPIDRIRARLILLKSLLRYASLKEITGEEAPRLEEELPEDFWERQGTHFKNVLAAMTDGLAGGRFFVRPNSMCAWCDYRLACRRLHVPTVRRAESDPAAAAYWSIVEGQR